MFLFNVTGAFSDRFTGWSQAGVAAVSFAIILGAAGLVNKARGRRLLQPPNEIGTVELALFVLVPVIPPLLFSNERVAASLGVVGVNLLVLGLAYVVVGYGMVPTTVWAARQTYRHLSQLLTLMGRALPFVLVFSAFLFLNAELWQVARDFTRWPSGSRSGSSWWWRPVSWPSASPGRSPRSPASTRGSGSAPWPGRRPLPSPRSTPPP